MEKKIKKVQETVDKEYYVAFNGKEFDNMYDCVEYELLQSENYIYEHEVSQTYLENFYIFECGVFNYDTMIVTIRLDNDEAYNAVVSVLNENLSENERNKLQEIRNKNEVVSVVDCQDNGWYYAGTYEEVIKEFADQVKEVFKRN